MSGISGPSQGHLTSIYNGTYALIDPVTLISPRGLRRWFNALGTADYAPVEITVAGDSIPLGNGAQATTAATVGYNTGADELQIATYGWVGQLRKMFAGRYGSTGEGTLHASDLRHTPGSAIAWLFGGAFNTGKQLAAGQSMTFAASACTDIKLFWYDIGSSGSGDWAYTVDGGGAVTVTAGSAGWKSVTLTGLANTSHTIVVTAGTQLNLSEIKCNIGTTGVRVNRYCQGGQGAPNLGSNVNILIGTWLNTATKLAIISIGTNDWVFNSDSTSQFKANLKVQSDYVASQGGCTLFLSQPDRGTATSRTDGVKQADYYAQMSALAVENDHVAYLDVIPAFGKYAQSFPDLYVDSPGVHPHMGGHGIIAKQVYSALTRSAKLSV